MHNFKVSLITPCFNGESHLMPYIDGLLSQTYSNVEYIFVNDGSTDKTEEIILSYKEQFEKKGWIFIYIKQENMGQVAACNQGYKIMSGEYFSQIDSDDILLPTFFEEMGAFLDDHSEFALVYPTAEYVKEKTFEHIRVQKRTERSSRVNTFIDDCIYMTGNLPIYSSYMARCAAFFSVIPSRQIAELSRGQNLQMLFPLALKYKFGYLDKILFKYVIRESSHSHSVADDTYDAEIFFCDIIRILNMPEYEKAYYFCKIKDFYYNINYSPNSENKILNKINEFENNLVVLQNKLTLVEESCIKIIDVPAEPLRIEIQNTEKCNSLKGKKMSLKSILKKMPVMRQISVRWNFLLSRLDDLEMQIKQNKKL